jgi:hypothetical protein
MKKLIFLLSVICSCTKAQDTIRFRNGEVQTVKVSEVGVTEIHYNRFDNLQGPKYIAEKNDILLIKYAGGQVDSFKVVKPEVKVAEKPSGFNVKSGCEKIVIRDGKLFCNYVAIGESRLSKIILSVEDNDKKNRMLKCYTEMKQYKKKQYLIGFVGLGVAVAAPYIGFWGSVIEGDLAPFAVGVAIGGAVGITGGVISSIHKQKRKAKKLEIARIYNE